MTHSLMKKVRKIGKEAGKIIIFLCLVFFMILQLDKIVQPVWQEWGNHDGLCGFYEEPKNSIETIFVGTSVVGNGIIPMKLYENYGISAYLLQSAQQPITASLAWVREAYNRNPQTLKNVVLDPAALRFLKDDVQARKAFDEMKLSANKIDAINSWTDSWKDRFQYLFPVFYYHDRWNAFEDSDYSKFYDKPKQYMHGYEFTLKRYYFNENPFENVTPPAYKIGEQCSYEIAEFSINNFLELVAFCEEKDLNLILAKMPVVDSWGSDDHNAVQKVLDDYGLDQIEFLDFNYQPLINETGYEHFVDSMDGRHLNYWGAEKITDWMGRHLTEHYPCTDVRGMKGYEHLEKELKQFNSYTASEKLMKCEDAAQYIQTANEIGDYIITITAREDAAACLTDEQRNSFREMGLVELAELEPGNPYTCVMRDGEVLYEKRVPIVEEEEEQGNVPEALYEELLEDKTEVYAFSGKKDGYIKSESTVNGVSCSNNEIGLNIGIYDYKNKMLVENEVFHTNTEEKREVDHYIEELDNAMAGDFDYEALSENARKLYGYRVRCEEKNLVSAGKMDLAEEDIIGYLKLFTGNDLYKIAVIISGEASDYLTEETLQGLRELGLMNVPGIISNAPYIAVVEDNQILYEEKGEEKTTLSMSDGEFEIESGQDMVSCRVNGQDISCEGIGIHVIVYNTFLKNVSDNRLFKSMENE